MNEHSMTYSCLTTMALKKIATKLKLDVKEWTAPRIFSESGSYKVNWYCSEDINDEEYITLYDDGTYQYYGEIVTREGKIPPLHSSVWVKKLMAKGIVPGNAVFAIEFFRNLRKRKSP